MFKKTILSVCSAVLAASLLFSCAEKEPQKTGSPEQAGGETTEAGSVRVIALQGPTGMGLSAVWRENAEGEKCAFDLQVLPSSEISNAAAALLTGDCDIAAVPVNLASNLYQKSGGQVTVLCANTLGVLHLLENGNSVKSLADLKGKTVMATGFGSTPEYVLRYLLRESGLDPEVDLDLRFVADHAELAAFLAANAYAVGVLPEPNATAVLAKNAGFRRALDLSEEWKKVTGKELVQGVFVVRNAFLEKNPALVSAFLEKYAESVRFTNENPAEAAKIIVQAGVGTDVGTVEKAIPGCHIVSLTGTEMRDAVSATLEVLYGYSPASVGDALPEADAYYLP